MHTGTIQTMTLIKPKKELMMKHDKKKKKKLGMSLASVKESCQPDWMTPVWKMALVKDNWDLTRL